MVVKICGLSDREQALSGDPSLASSHIATSETTWQGVGGLQEGWQLCSTSSEPRDMHSMFAFPVSILLRLVLLMEGVGFF